MRFLLVNPFYHLAETPSPPLGISYLAAALERAGVEVRVLDMVVSGYSQAKLETVLNDFQPHIVGATSVTMTFNSAIGVIEDVKAINPEIVTAMGGAHVSFCAESTMREHPALDVVAMTEGEDMIVEIARGVERGDLSDIPGIAYRDGDELRNNGPRGYWIDVDTLPVPARHLVPLTRYRALRMPISMTTSRGCPFQCIFCTGRQLVGAKIRYRKAESVVDEMTDLAARGFHQVNLADDLFTARKPHAHAVCDEILRRGLPVTWTSFSNVNTVDVPLLKKMREAGCVMVSFGLESSDPAILKAVKKGTKVHKILEAAEMCAEAGVHAHGSFIVGLPGETPETLKANIAFAKRLKEMGCETGFHMLAPFPGTAVYEDRERLGIRLLTDDWSQFHANHAITEQDAASWEMMETLAQEMERGSEERFYKLAKAVDDGTATEEERENYAYVERQGVYYDLMLRDVLETDGAWPCERRGISQADALAGLVTRVQEATGKTTEVVERALSFALERKLMRYEAKGGVCRWEWADSPESLTVTEAARPARSTPAPMPARAPLPAEVGAAV